MPDLKLDCKGQSCPMPINISRAIKKMDLGQVLEVEATDPAFRADLEAWCKKLGHSLVSFVEGAPSAVNARMADILDNVEFGFFTIGRDHLVGEQVSASCRQLLGTDDLTHRRVETLLSADPRLQDYLAARTARGEPRRSPWDDVRVFGVEDAGLVPGPGGITCREVAGA